MYHTVPLPVVYRTNGSTELELAALIHQIYVYFNQNQQCGSGSAQIHIDGKKLQELFSVLRSRIEGPAPAPA